MLLEAQSARTTWDGKPAFQVFLRDHSERRRAEAAVRYQANLLASVSDAVLATDLDGQITGWNPAAVELYRLPSSAALGRPVSDVLGRESTTPAGAIRPGEMTHLRTDGTSVAVRVAVAPLRDDMGQPSGEVAVCADQSYRLLAAAERRLAESRFTTVVTALSEGIVVMAADGTINSINPAAQALLGDAHRRGRQRADGPGANRVFVDNHGDPLPVEEHPAAAVLATGTRQHDKVFGFDDDRGGRHWWSMSCETLERGADGGPASIVCSITDVTDRRASERRLTHAAAHDSLTGLANRSQLIRVLGECLESAVCGRGPVRGSGPVQVRQRQPRSPRRRPGPVHHRRSPPRRRRTDRGPSGGWPATSSWSFCPATSEGAALAMAQLIRESVAQPIQIGDEREAMVTSQHRHRQHSRQRRHRPRRCSAMPTWPCTGPSNGAGRASRSSTATLRAAEVPAPRPGRAPCVGPCSEEQVEVHYQPIISLDTGRTTGYEALARWTDPDLGAVEPAEFIPVAEDHGLIVALGRSMSCFSPAGRRRCWTRAARGTPRSFRSTSAPTNSETRS